MPVGLSVLSFCSAALTSAKVLKPGSTPTGTQLQVAMQLHFEMVTSWSSRRLRLPYIPEAQYPMTAGKGTYLIGPGAADFNTTPVGGPPPVAAYTKPQFIEAASVIVGTARRIPLNILTRPQWDINQTKSLMDPDGPIDLFYDYNSPIATINVACKPGGNQVLFIAQWNALMGFVPGQEQFDVLQYYPPEYIKPMRYGLAIEACAAFGTQVTSDITTPFAESIQQLEQKNNDKLSGAFGTTRTLDGPAKGDGSPVAQQGQ